MPRREWAEWGNLLESGVLWPSHIWRLGWWKRYESMQYTINQPLVSHDILSKANTKISKGPPLLFRQLSKRCARSINGGIKNKLLLLLHTVSLHRLLGNQGPLVTTSSTYNSPSWDASTRPTFQVGVPTHSVWSRCLSFIFRPDVEATRNMHKVADYACWSCCTSQFKRISFCPHNSWILMESPQPHH